MRREVSELFECRSCGGLTASNPSGGCPYCGKTHVGSKKVKTMDGGTETVKKDWYRRLKIVPERVQE